MALKEGAGAMAELVAEPEGLVGWEARPQNRLQEHPGDL